MCKDMTIWEFNMSAVKNKKINVLFQMTLRKERVVDVCGNDVQSSVSL